MNRALQCVILAGGLGTRMRPLTERLPKSLLPAAGRPFLGHQLERLASQGIRNVVLSIGHRGEAIREYARDGYAWGVDIRYVDEGDALLGTGGALRLALEAAVLENEFLVLYGDSFTPISFGDVADAFRRSGLPALMVILRNEERWDRSNVLYEDGKLIVYDKARLHPRSAGMRHIDYGVSALTRELIARLPHGRSDLSSLFYQLSVEGQLAAFEAPTRFYEIGSPAGLRDFEQYVTGERK